MFNQSNYGNGNNNNNGNSDKKKTNFKVAKMYGTDGILEITVWSSDKGGVYGILSIKAAIGKDPSTGLNAYEQKIGSELPRVMMNAELLRALIEYCKTTPIDQLNGELDTGRGSSLTINGSSNEVKLTINNQKNGTRSITFKAVTIGSKTINSNFMNFMEYMNICYKYTKTAKLDSDEFSKALADDTSTEESSEECPF